MPKAYWVTTYRQIKDPAKLEAYAKLAPVALAPFGVRYLCRGKPNATYESGMKERLVVSEFPSLEKAIAGHDSPGYQEALRARSATAPCATSASLRAWSKGDGLPAGAVLLEKEPARHRHFLRRRVVLHQIVV